MIMHDDKLMLAIFSRVLFKLEVVDFRISWSGNSVYAFKPGGVYILKGWP